MILQETKTYKGRAGFLKGLFFKCLTWDTANYRGTVQTLGQYKRTFEVTATELNEIEPEVQE